MFNLGGDSKELVIIGLIALGLYAQCNELNLANNTTILLILFLLFLNRSETEEINRELCCVGRMTGTEGCRCGVRNRGF